MAIANINAGRPQLAGGAIRQWPRTFGKIAGSIDAYWPLLAMFLPFLLIPNALRQASAGALAVGCLSTVMTFVFARWISGDLKIATRLPDAMLGIGMIVLMLAPAMAVAEGSGTALLALLIVDLVRRQTAYAAATVALSSLVFMLTSEVAVILFDLPRSTMLLALVGQLGLIGGLASLRKTTVDWALADPFRRFVPQRLIVDSALGLAFICFAACFMAYLGGERQLELASGHAVWLTAPFAMIAIFRAWDLVMTARAWTMVQFLLRDPLFAVSFAGWLVLTSLTIGPLSELLSH